jgi:hypothetical protein
LKKNSLSLEYSILNVVKTYKLNVDPSNLVGISQVSIDASNKINLNKIRMYYFFTKDSEGFMKFIKDEKVKIRLLYDNNVELASAQYSLKEFRSPYVNKIGINSMLCGKNN